MPVYKYVGRDVFNRLRRGRVEADNPEVAKNLILARGVVAIEKLKEDKGFLSKEISLSLLDRVSLKDIVLFTRQLYAMVHAGIPIVNALKILKEHHNVFLTGAAGSGKTYLLNEYIEYCYPPFDYFPFGNILAISFKY